MLLSDDSPDDVVRLPIRSVAKTRACLSCNKKFKSSHTHNRMCRKCKNTHNSSEWDTWGGKILYDDS